MALEGVKFFVVLSLLEVHVEWRVNSDVLSSCLGAPLDRGVVEWQTNGVDLTYVWKLENVSFAVSIFNNCVSEAETFTGVKLCDLNIETK